MFSLLNKDGEFGIRFSKEVQEKYFTKLKTTHFKSHDAILNGYVLIPNSMWKGITKLAKMLNESYDYVMTLEPK